MGLWFGPGHGSSITELTAPAVRRSVADAPGRDANARRGMRVLISALANERFGGRIAAVDPSIERV